MRTTFSLIIFAFMMQAANASETSRVNFSLFGDKFSASDLFRSGSLIKKHIDCATNCDISTEGELQFHRAIHDVYQLSFTSIPPNFKLNIEDSGTIKTISLSYLEQLPFYDTYFANNYAACVDFALCCTNSIAGKSISNFAFEEEKGRWSRPSVHESGGSLKIKADLSIQSNRAIHHSFDVFKEANEIRLKKVIYSTHNGVSLEVRPSPDISPIIRSVFFTAQKISSPDFKANNSYNACLVDGYLSSNIADISVFDANQLIINFDASIIDV